MLYKIKKEITSVLSLKFSMAKHLFLDFPFNIPWIFLSDASDYVH